MQIINKKVSELKEYENNPRNNKDAVAAVAESIKEFGFKVPIVIDAKNIIICGHTRLKAAKKLKLKEVPCVIAEDLTEEQIKAFRLADNKTSEIATWDDEKLKSEIDSIFDIDLARFGFDLQDLNFKERKKEIEEDNYDITEDSYKRYEVKLGDIWQLGKHRLLCGDCTASENYNLLMDGHKADLVVTDPPYRVNYIGKTKDALTMKNDNIDEAAFCELLDKAFYNISETLKNGKSWYIWHADTEGLIFREKARKNLGEIRQCLIWVKNTFVLGRQDYQWQHEPCLYGWKEGKAHYFINDRSQATVLQYDKPNRNEEHPTMKPILLIARLIKNSSKEKEKVLDTFGGSGSTLIACEQLNRSCYIMEIEPKYCSVIITRWEEYTGRKAVRINGS